MKTEKADREERVEHTPLPWKIDRLYPDDIRTEDGALLIANIYSRPDEDEQLANARLIVTAVNSHEALVSALRGLFEQVECGNLQRNTSGDSEPGWAIKQIPLVQALEAARAALQAAGA